MAQLHGSEAQPQLQARRHARVPVSFPVYVRSDGLRLGDMVCDVSEGGLGVVTTSPLPETSLVSLRLEPPRAEPIELLARVMWVSETMMGLRVEQHEGDLLDAVDRLRRALDRI